LHFLVSCFTGDYGDPWTICKPIGTLVLLLLLLLLLTTRYSEMTECGLLLPSGASHSVKLFVIISIIISSSRTGNIALEE
jgi:hypothetical protein